MKKRILSTIRKSALALCMAAIPGIVTTATLSSCSGDSVQEQWDKEEESMTNYWGKDYSYLEGIWVEEPEKDNPSAGYTIVKPGRLYESVNMVTQNRVVSGSLTFYHSETHGVKFGDANTLSLKWLDSSHTRIEVHSFNPYTDEVYPEVVAVWVKVSSIPSGWSK